MITDGSSYREYLEADRLALKRVFNWRTRWFDDVWNYQISLRRYEYYLNTTEGDLLKIAAWLDWRRKGRRLGFTIPPNVFGSGLSIAHYGGIVVNSKARIGMNCRIHVGVNIGSSAGEGDCVPVIGNNCYIGPGAKIFGDISIGDNVAVGANAVVNRSFPSGVTLGGIPARVIATSGSDGLI